MLRNRSNKLDVKFYVLIVTTLVVLGSESLLARVYFYLFPGRSTLQINMLFFIAGVILYCLANIYIIYEIKRRTRVIDNKKQLTRWIYSLVVTVQSVTIFMLFFVSYQAITYLSYSTVVIIFIILLTYILANFNMIILAERFLRWVIANRDIVIFVFLIATIAIILNTAITMILVSTVLSSQPQEIRWHVGILVPTLSKGFSFLDTLYNSSYFISYLFTWIASVILLRNYAQKIGKKKFWFLVTLPLLYFLGLLQPIILDIFYPLIAHNPVLFTITYTIFFGGIKLVGSIFFGIGLWAVARRIEQESIRSFMNLSAFGLILLFISNQAVLLLNNLFPPIGLTMVSFVGISAFLLLIGFYSSALSVANDIKVRKAIRKSVENESKLLSNIGEAELQFKVRKKVITMTHALSKNLEEETGIESSLTPEDIKNYTNLAINEVKKSKEPN